jgi:hypothetical protein
VSRERSTRWQRFYSVFNENKPGPISPRNIPRFDVELRRITTFTQLPETGERVKVVGFSRSWLQAGRCL